MNPISNYFLKDYIRSDSERLRKAKALLYLTLSLIFFAAFYAVVSLVSIKNPSLTIICFVGVILTLICLYLIKKNKYEYASILLIYLVWLVFTALAIVPIITKFRPLSILTRNSTLVFIFIVLFSNQKRHLISIFLMNLLALILLHIPGIGTTKFNEE